MALFVTCDVISLILQAVGGGWAASSDFPVPKAPTNIMVAGIIFQLVSMIIFSLLACDFMYRAWRKKPYQRKVRKVVDEPIGETGSGATEGTEGSEGEKFDEVERSAVVRGWWWVMAGTAICSLMIIVRGVYRSVELVQGWNGYVISRGMSSLSIINVSSSFCVQRFIRIVWTVSPCLSLFCPSMFSTRAFSFPDDGNGVELRY